MSTEVSIDLLRKTLVRHGHIVPTCDQLDQGPRVLNQGEYLVSIMSHDEQILSLLYGLESADIGVGGLYVSGDRNRGYLIGGILGADFDLWVETVKFVWLTRGVNAAINFVRNVGLYGWSNHSVATRHRYIDDLVLMAQKSLRRGGVKFSDMAELFQDIDLAKAKFENPRYSTDGSTEAIEADAIATEGQRVVIYSDIKSRR